MTFLKQQCEENKKRHEREDGLLEIDKYDFDAIDEITHSTALALRKEIEKRLPEEKDCGVYKSKETGKCRVCDFTPEMRKANNTLRTQVLEIIRELVPDDV